MKPVTIRWRRSVTVGVILLLTPVGCSSGDDASGSDDATGSEDSSGSEDFELAGDQQDSADDEDITGMDPDFDPGSLPDDFPSELVPDSFTAGQYFELGGVRTANYESSSSFDDVVAEYNAKTGVEPIIVEGDERVATWTLDNDWAVNVLERASEGAAPLISIGSLS